MARSTQGADVFTMEFGGGGRAKASGIDLLTDDSVSRFVEAFDAAFGSI